MTIHAILEAAHQVKPLLATMDGAGKNAAIHAMAGAIEAERGRILEANAEDMKEARGSVGAVMLDRLLLTDERVMAMADGMRAVADLPDPVGRILNETTTVDGLVLRKVAVPIGVVAIIYESRPNVTSDAAALCLKSGNICILRCGREARRSVLAIVDALRSGLAGCGLPCDLVNAIDDVTHEGAGELMRANGLVDLLIPRGGKTLIRACMEGATVPCIETGIGICSVYVDSAADLAKALDIVDNAKTQRPSVCNAVETCLVAADIAPVFLPELKARLVDDRLRVGRPPVTLRLCRRAGEIIQGTPAGPEDFDTEFLDYVLAVKVVDGVKEAVRHIFDHSSHHSDAIVTEDGIAAEYFTTHVDSAAVYVNASTRFTDGGCFGFGCEMGISTQRLHARGPMGLLELTTYKYVILGNGQMRRT